MISQGITNARTIARFGGAPGPNLDLAPLAAVSLALAFFPVCLYVGIHTATAIPLALLTGLLSHHFFRLLFYPGRTDLFVPSTIVAVYFLVYFVLRSIALETIPFFGRVGKNYYDDYIPMALWCASVGYLALLVGSSSAIASRCISRLSKVRVTWPGSAPIWRLWLAMAVGLACVVYLFRIGVSVGNFSSQNFQQHPPPGIVIFLVKLVDYSWIALCMFLLMPGRRRTQAALLLSLLLCLVIIAIQMGTSGGKVALIQPLMELALCFHYGRRRFRIWEMMLLGIPTLLLAFGMMNFYRFVVIGSRGVPKSLSDVVSRVSSASDMLSSGHGTASQRSALEQVVERAAGVDAVALIMKYTPHPFSYRYGIGWLETPLTFVPRQVWANKPIIMPAAEFEFTYMSEPKNYNGFSSMHMVGDLYRNFSFAGVVVGMFVLGVLLQIFYLFCSPASDNPPGLFLYAAVFPELIHSFERDLGSAVSTVIRVAVVAIATAFFLGMRYRKLNAGERAPAGRSKLRMLRSSGLSVGASSHL